MWLELKIGIDIIAWILIAVVVSQILFLNVILSFLLLAGFFLTVFSDFLIGWIIKSSKVDILMDSNPSGYETCILCDFSGNVDFVQVKKGPQSKREFTKYGKEASIINRGRYPIRLPNGNFGFIGHEDLDLDVDLDECEALDKLPGDDIKEIVENLEDKLENIEGGVMND